MRVGAPAAANWLSPYRNAAPGGNGALSGTVVDERIADGAANDAHFHIWRADTKAPYSASCGPAQYDYKRLVGKFLCTNSPTGVRSQPENPSKRLPSESANLAMSSKAIASPLSSP